MSTSIIPTRRPTSFPSIDTMVATAKKKTVVKIKAPVIKSSKQSKKVSKDASTANCARCKARVFKKPAPKKKAALKKKAAPKEVEKEVLEKEIFSESERLTPPLPAVAESNDE